MKKAKLWIGAAAFMSVIATDLFAADLNVNVRGRVKDYESKEALIGATVRIVGRWIGAVTEMEVYFKV